MEAQYEVDFHVPAVENHQLGENVVLRVSQHEFLSLNETVPEYVLLPTLC